MYIRVHTYIHKSRLLDRSVTPLSIFKDQALYYDLSDLHICSLFVNIVVLFQHFFVSFYNSLKVKTILLFVLFYVEIVIVLLNEDHKNINEFS